MSPAPRGRPRSETARRAVLDAAQALLAEGGYRAATIEAVAARSGVAKTTIYRWWPNRAALVVDLLVDLAAVAAPPPHGPDPLRALRVELGAVARSADELPGRILVSLLGEAESDQDIRAALQERLFKPRRAASGRMVQRAQERGQMRAGVPAHLATDLIFGPLFFRKYIRHEPVTGSFLRELWQHVMLGLAPRAEAARRPGRARRPRPGVTRRRPGS